MIFKMFILNIKLMSRICKHQKVSGYLFYTTEVGLVKTENRTEVERKDDKEDEIEQKRHVCRMPRRFRNKMMKIPDTPDEVLNRQPWWVTRNKHRNILRKHYANYGEASGVNIGCLWPTKAELEDMKELEQVKYPTPLHTMLENIAAKKQMEKSKQEEREKEVLENYEKLEGWMKEFEARKEKKLAEALEQKKKKEKLIEEVRVFLGYQVDIHDERFQEIVQKKEKEQKKAEKEARKKEKIARELERLKLQGEQEKKAMEKLEEKQETSSKQESES